jgi:hypothetical protein
MKYGFSNTSEQSAPQDQEPPLLAVGNIPLSTPLPAARLDVSGNHKAILYLIVLISVRLA